MPARAAAAGTEAAVRRVLWATLGLNLLVSAGKVVVGRLSGSLSMEADGYHSLLDGSNNVIGLIILAYAYEPPDRAHPYGHRKFETAATLAIGGVLLALAYRVAEGALRGFSLGTLPEIGPLNWAVMLLTLAVNVFVARFEAREGQRLGSAYLVADSAHTASDIYVTLGVLASFAGAHAGIRWLDGLIATGIAAFIAYLATRILIGAFHVLTDRAVLAPEALVGVVSAVPGVQDCRDVRTRGVHGAVYVDLVVHVDGRMSLQEAHDVSDRIETALKRSNPGIVDVVVHLEPARS